VGSSTNTRAAALRQLIDADRYVVVPAEVAEAIVTRCATRLHVAAATFRNDLGPGEPRVRSFRLDERVPSFRACGPRGRVHARR